MFKILAGEKNILFGYSQNICDLTKTGCGNFILSKFIFLELLVGNMELFSNLTLSKAPVLPDFSDPEADLYIMLCCTPWFLLTHFLLLKIRTNLSIPISFKRRGTGTETPRAKGLASFRHIMGKNLIYKRTFISSTHGIFPKVTVMTQLPPEVIKGFSAKLVGFERQGSKRA